MFESSEVPGRRYAGLWLSTKLSALLLLISCFTFLETLAFMFDRHSVLKDFEWSSLVFSRPGLMLAAFLAFVLAGHLLIALLVWWSACAWHRRLQAPAARLRVFVLASWVVWAAALLFANAGVSPWSDSARFLRDFAELGAGPVHVWHGVVFIALASLWPALRETWARLLSLDPRHLRLGAAIVAVLVVLPTVVAGPLQRQQARQDRPPNVIIIGIDSLRLPWVGAFGGEDTPHIDRFLTESMHFEWSFTPLARTFGSWMSVLTGQNPRRNGVRENVMPPEAYADSVTLAHHLRAAGWRTVYATDEVRFAPIDEEMGFDQVIGPPIGAHDFLIGTVADLPIANVFTNTFIGRWFLPTLHANRVAAVSYQPETFDELVWDELPRGEEPLFLAVHFTLPHHPTYWADAPRTVTFVPRAGIAYKPLMHEQLMRAATREVDAQVGRFLAEAERRGLLDNAIVVLMSDHGEATGLPEEDSLVTLHTPKDVLGLKFANSLVGHGNSTTSVRQFETLLAFRRYGGGEAWRGKHSLQTSLIDIAPTVLGLLGVPDASAMDGVDLSPLLRGERPAEAAINRMLFTETGFSTFGMKHEADLDERRVFLESIHYYHMDYARGRITFRPDQIPYLLEIKERAVIATPWVMAAVPSLFVNQNLWVVYNLNTGDWVRYPQDLGLLPGNPPARLMERRLLEEYSGELTPPQAWSEQVTVRAGTPLEAEMRAELDEWTNP